MTAAIAIKLLAVLVTAAIGYVAGRMKWLVIGTPGSDAARVLSNVAFYVFIPALLFRTTARLDFATMPWRTIAAFFVPVIGVMLADADSHDLSKYGEVVQNEEDAEKRYIQVKAEEVTRVTSRLLADLPIHDITIADPPIEDVIEQAFNA